MKSEILSGFLGLAIGTILVTIYSAIRIWSDGRSLRRELEDQQDRIERQMMECFPPEIRSGDCDFKAFAEDQNRRIEEMRSRARKGGRIMGIKLVERREPSWRMDRGELLWLKKCRRMGADIFQRAGNGNGNKKPGTK